jgi:hypothetical protein
MPTTENAQMEKIIDQRIGNKSERKTYFEYLVKWKCHPTEDASWVNEYDIKKHRKNNAGDHGHESMNFWPEEYDAGASPSTLKRPCGGLLNTQCANLKLFLNFKEECIFMF